MYKSNCYQFIATVSVTLYTCNAVPKTETLKIEFVPRTHIAKHHTWTTVRFRHCQLKNAWR